MRKLNSQVGLTAALRRRSVLITGLDGCRAVAGGRSQPEAVADKRCRPKVSAGAKFYGWFPRSGPSAEPSLPHVMLLVAVASAERSRLGAGSKHVHIVRARPRDVLRRRRGGTYHAQNADRAYGRRR